MNQQLMEQVAAKAAFETLVVADFGTRERLSRWSVETTVIDSIIMVTLHNIARSRHIEVEVPLHFEKVKGGVRVSVKVVLEVSYSNVTRPDIEAEVYLPLPQEKTHQKTVSFGSLRRCAA